MTRRPPTMLLRAAADSAIGLVVFLFLAAIISAPSWPVFQPWSVAPVGANAQILVLASVFSVIVAFNLAFYRHLRRVYASPRRGAWRRSR